MMGIVRRVDEDDPAAGFEMVGMVDFRLHWPQESIAYVGMLMVAEPYQRQGIGTQAWRLLAAMAGKQHGDRNRAPRRGAVQPGRAALFPAALASR